jgi:hypothetical protein
MNEPFTLTNLYLATGEGMTRWLMYMLASDAETVLAEYRRRVGDYFATGAKVMPGFDFEATKGLLTPELQAAIAKRDYGNVLFFAEFHVNYS